MRKTQDLTRRATLAAVASSVALPALAQPPTLKTPGVYIAELDAFPNSIVGVETAVVAFVGAASQSTTHAYRMSSFAEYITLHGQETPPRFALEGSEPYETSSRALIERSVRWFYENGGASAYVLAAGRPEEPPTLKAMLDALARAADLRDVTLLVAPDAIRLPPEDCITFQQAMLAHCADLADRFAILDVHPGLGAKAGSGGRPLDAVTAFGETIGTTGAAYGAAYYPMIETSLFLGGQFSIAQFDDHATVTEFLLQQDVAAGLDVRRTRKIYEDVATFDFRAVRDGDKAASRLAQQLNSSMYSVSPAFRALQDKMAKLRNWMPASPAVAGVYAQTDSAYGVWRSPANRPLAGAIAPSVSLDNRDTAAMNNPPSGPPVNAIRSFIGESLLVWGARTLDASDPDNRYVSVRRTIIFLKSSIGVALQGYAFAENDAKTWAAVRAMIASFLTSQWQQGALAGSQPDEAFAVQCGLGSTMTQQDILDGRMRVSVQVAMTKPAEFQLFDFDVAMGVR